MIRASTNGNRSARPGRRTGPLPRRRRLGVAQPPFTRERVVANRPPLQRELHRSTGAFEQPGNFTGVTEAINVLRYRQARPPRQLCAPPSLRHFQTVLGSNGFCVLASTEADRGIAASQGVAPVDIFRNRGGGHLENIGMERPGESRSEQEDGKLIASREATAGADVIECAEVIKHDERMTTNRGGSTHSVITGWHLRPCSGLVEVSSPEQLRRLGQMAPAICGATFLAASNVWVSICLVFSRLERGKADHKKDARPDMIGARRVFRS